MDPHMRGLLIIISPIHPNDIDLPTWKRNLAILKSSFINNNERGPNLDSVTLESHGRVT